MFVAEFTGVLTKASGSDMSDDRGGGGAGRVGIIGVTDPEDAEVTSLFVLPEFDGVIEDALSLLSNNEVEFPL